MEEGECEGMPGMLFAGSLQLEPASVVRFCVHLPSCFALMLGTQGLFCPPGEPPFITAVSS